MVHKFALVLLAIAMMVAGAPTAVAYPLHNPNNAVDVDDDGIVRPRDFLLIVNRIQTQNSPSLAGLAEGPTYFWDTSDDNRVTPRDALLVANHILATPEPASALPAVLGLLALGGYCCRRRRKRD